MAKFTLNLSGPLLKLPPSIKAASFDYVGRYQLLAEIISRYFEAINGKPNKILDVGGLGGLLEQLLPINVVILDSEASDSEQEKQGDGAHMQSIKDGSYDVVVSSDTLEHIKPKDRRAFITELLRVSSDLVIICAPFNRSQGAPAEESKLQDLHQYILEEPDRWLREHQENGLPEEKQILSYIPKEFSAVAIHHSSLKIWRQLLSINLLANKIGDPALQELAHKLNGKYNDNLLFNDFSDDGYRTFIIISKTNDINIKTPNPNIKPEDYLEMFQFASEFYLETLKHAEELPRINKQIESLRAGQHELRLHIQDMVESRSWKFTAPLRKAHAIKPKRRGSL